MKITLSIILTFIVFIVSFSQKLNYDIKGTVKGSEDNSWLILSDLSSGSYLKIDSIKIKNEKFQFKGMLKAKIMQFAIHTQDYEDRVSFWVENNPVTIITEKGKYREASIKGSKTQSEAEQFYKALDEAEDKVFVSQQFIKEHPSSIISAIELESLRKELPKTTISKLFEVFSPTVKKSSYGKKISDYLLLSINPQIGDKYIDFEEKNSKGKLIKLSQYQGKVILLDFWGTWCGPCIEELPDLVSIYKEFNHKGFEILGVAADTKMEKITKVEERFGITWDNVSDLRGDQNKSAIIYGVSYYPTNFLIDKNGIIIARDLTGDDLKNKLKELLE